jgi:glycosidase
MTYPGAPTIYYGDEVALTGGDDPLNRATYPWEEDGGKPDYEMLKEFKKLTKLRNENVVLRRGSVEVVYCDDNVVAMLRKLGNQYVLVLVNNAQKDKNVIINLSQYDLPSKMVNPLKSDESISIDGEDVTLTVKAVSGTVYM